jgi:hypothetical protein
VLDELLLDKIDEEHFLGQFDQRPKLQPDGMEGVFQYSVGESFPPMMPMGKLHILTG